MDGTDPAGLGRGLSGTIRPGTVERTAQPAPGGWAVARIDVHWRDYHADRCCSRQYATFARYERVFSPNEGRAPVDRRLTVGKGFPTAALQAVRLSSKANGS
jgi:hypothetical protein